ncbi:MAG: hypothetical protein KDD53_12450 [Bdellovibrionales bacterium]|nr:hypothetical protein [Bdellovibrionales bacterium]
MKRTILNTISLICLVTLSACAGNGGDGGPVSDFTGTWNVRYNFDTDQCQVVTPPILGFVDEHTIVQEGSELTLVAASTFPEFAEGTTGSDGSFVAVGTVIGDVFGDGSTCELTTSISYQSTGSTSAESLFALRISCNDGFECVSEGLGTSNLQPIG